MNNTFNMGIKGAMKRKKKKHSEWELEEHLPQIPLKGTLGKREGGVSQVQNSNMKTKVTEIDKNGGGVAGEVIKGG